MTYTSSDARIPQAAAQQPVIINSSLDNDEITKYLQGQQHLKIKVTDSTTEDSIIFPRSGLAFLVLTLSDAKNRLSPSQGGEIQSGLLRRIDKMFQVHRHFYVILVAAFHGPDEAAIFSQLQIQYLGKGLNIIPCHNALEAVNIMTDITKITGRTEPAALTLRDRIRKTLQLPNQ